MVEVLDSEDELGRVFGVRLFGLIVLRPDDSSEDEEEGMALNQRKGLRDLMAGLSKGSSFKKVLKS